MKTFGLVSVRQDRSILTSEDDFLDQIFVGKNRASIKIYAKEVLQMLVNGTLTEQSFKELNKTENKITYRQFYHCLQKFKSIGLVYKKDGYYLPSEKFISNLNALSTYWTGIINKYDQTKKESTLTHSS